LEINVVRANCNWSFPGLDQERFEESPVFEIMSVSRSIVDAVQTSIVDRKGCELCKSALSSLLQDSAIKIFKSQNDAVCGQDLA